MNLHEFQAKELLDRFGIPVPRGRIAASAIEAGSVARRLGLERCVVKAQVLAGDRAAHGGVRFAAGPEEAARSASELIGRPLVTTQTGPAGQTVHWVYVEEEVAHERALYCAVIVDRTTGGLALITRDLDGADPGRALVAHDAGTMTGLTLSESGVLGDFEGAAASLGLAPSHTALLAKRLAQLAEAAVALDAIQVEISPLVLTHDGDLVALDAKLIVDDNALFRHPELGALRELSEPEGDDLAELAAQ